jgi:NADH pyrophosphatase NudC (nudix superfamily)
MDNISENMLDNQKEIALKNKSTLIRLNDGTRITIRQNKDLKINEISINHHNTPFNNNVKVDEVATSKDCVIDPKVKWSSVKSIFTSQREKDFGAMTIVKHLGFKKRR